jgi:hypothetical protein
VSNVSGIVSTGSRTVVDTVGIVSGGWGSVAAGGDGASVVVVVVEVVVVELEVLLELSGIVVVWSVVDGSETVVEVS